MGATRASHFHKSVAREVGVGVTNGVEVDLPLSGGLSEGLEDVAGGELAALDASPNELGDLMVERDWTVGVDFVHGLMI